MFTLQSLAKRIQKTCCDAFETNLVPNLNSDFDSSRSVGENLRRARMRALIFATALSLLAASPLVFAAPMNSANETKNPLPSTKPPRPNSNTEEQSMKEFSEYGFSPRTPKNQAYPETEPRPQESTEEAAASESDDRPRLRSPRGRRTSRRTKKPKLPLPEQATTELLIRQEDRSPNVLATAATVRSRVDEVLSPIKHPTFLIGVSAQMYEARGRALLQGASPVDFGQPGAKPMVALDLRWTPYRIEALPRMNFGVFGSVGYVSHPVEIVAPTGALIANASLNTFKTQGGVAAEFHDTEDSNWSLRTQLGGGAFTASQSASSSYATATSTQLYGSGGLFYDYLLLKNVAASIGYEYRVPVGTTTANMEIQKHNFSIGLAGGFQ